MFGINVAFWITYGTKSMFGEWAWRLPFLLQLVPGFVLGVGVLMLPFSPRWLAAKSRDDEALQSLSKLRQLPSDDQRVLQEWFEIRAEVQFHREVNAKRHPNLQSHGASTWSTIRFEFVSWADCFKRGCWRRTHVGMGLYVARPSSLSCPLLDSAHRD